MASFPSRNKDFQKYLASKGYTLANNRLVLPGSRRDTKRIFNQLFWEFFHVVSERFCDQGCCTFRHVKPRGSM